MQFKSSFTVVIGTRLSLQNSNAVTPVFVTEPINVTINPDDEYHAFIVANNTSGSFIKTEFGSNDSKHGQTLIIATSNDLNFTYQIKQVDFVGVHMTLLTITFDEVTYTEFLARASETVVSDDGNKLIRVLFTYKNSSVMSYIELTPRKPTSTSSTEILTTMTISPISTSAVTNIMSTKVIIPTPTSNTPSISTTASRSDNLRFDCYVTTMALSFSVYLLLLLF